MHDRCCRGLAEAFTRGGIASSVVPWELCFRGLGRSHWWGVCMYDCGCGGWGRTQVYTGWCCRRRLSRAWAGTAVGMIRARQGGFCRDV